MGLSLAILLDSGPVGLLGHPRRPPELDLRMRMWRAAGATVFMPEISYYEVRRELRRLELRDSVSSLDDLARTMPYLPITTAIIVQADIRRRGRPTADALALDGDVILAATAMALEGEFDGVVLVTNNTRHLDQLVRTARWDEFSP